MQFKLNFILLSIFLSIFLCLKTLAVETSYFCENTQTEKKIHIVYHERYVKEEMAKNIWLFFQKIDKTENYLNITSLDNDKPIRQWKINLLSGEAILTPMFDPTSNWICKK